jgi:hypothetical protein
MAGLAAPANIRLTPEQPAAVSDEDVTVEVGGDDPDIDDIAQDGAILRIQHGDGSVTVALDGKPISTPRKDSNTGWFANLAEDIEEGELVRIADDLIRGVQEDITTRQDWSDAREQGMKLLGLKIEIPGLQGASDGAPVEGMSRVRDSLLLEACLRFQANARSELLPTDGPVKVRDDHNGSDSMMGHNGGPSMVGSTVEQDQLSDALEKDLNHYLTAVATEYYPDTDRMLLMLGFGGMAFKKVYFSPLKNRPMSESVDANDLIVNEAATDLKNAKRVTHRIMMRPSEVKRMQIIGAWREVPLGDPRPQELDAVQREEKSQQGLQPSSMRPEDRDREIYECYCELNIAGYEHTLKGKKTGLDVPYRVTIDLSSRQILSVVRNYDEDSKDLPEARSVFVKYTFVPGFGFCDIGLVHILANTTNAITAAVREMLDNGMYANFPGFLMADTGGRQNTNIFRVPPGGAAQVKTNGMAIGDAILPLPYNTQQMAPLMALVQDLRTNGQRIGGVSEQAVGEGKENAPVGTTLALIDQATKMVNSVHKRMHAAQAEEFQLLVECFREHPESFVNRKCISGNKWTEETFVKALNDCDLVPQADPNTASQTQRIMKLQAAFQLMALQPTLYDPLAMHTMALQALGYSNPEQFFAPPQAQAAQPPELQEIQAGIASANKIADAKVQEADAKTEIARAKTAEVQAKAAQGGYAAKPGLAGAGEKQPEPPSTLDQANAQAKLMDAETHQKALGVDMHKIAADTRNQDLDRQAEQHSDLIDLAKEIMSDPARAAQGAKETKPIKKEIGA